MARSNYPPRTCRDCGWARWTYSDADYTEKRRRIIVQQPGLCTNPDATDAGPAGGTKSRPDAMRPHARCGAWKAGGTG